MAAAASERRIDEAEVRRSRDEFNSYLPGFVEELVSAAPIAADLPEVRDWWRRVLDYNLRGGKKNRGVIAYYTCVKLSEWGGGGGTGAPLPAVPSAVTEERRRAAAAVGFALELMQASFLVEDDIMDKSETRRGQDCWYRVPGVGLMAVNDASMMECIMFKLLKNHCHGSRNYSKIVELFSDVRLKTIAGQCLDGILERERVYSLDNCSMDRYRRVVRYKTAYYSFLCPMVSGMLLAEWDDPAALRSVEAVLLDIGEYFQITDDFLDCYGDVAKTGKVGSDIKDGKCTWLLIKALERAGPGHRQTILDNLGAEDAENVGRVKAVYDELDMRAEFERFQDETVGRIHAAIDGLSVREPVPSLLYTILALVSKRER